MSPSHEPDDVADETPDAESGGTPPWTAGDWFDDVPEDGTRAGAHRAAGASAPHATRQILPVLLAGAVALAIGAVAYVSGDATAEAGPAGATATPSASQTSASPQATEETEAAVEPDATVQVGVYNAALVDGAAGTAAGQLGEAGWTVASIDNWGVGVNESVVYYEDEREQAEALAEELGIEQVVAEDAVSYPIVVVVGTDIAGGPTAEPVTVEEAPAPAAAAEQAPAEVAPVEPPVQDYVPPAEDYLPPAPEEVVPGAGGAAW
ncbi:LytR C-terminal domain-containing protein [Kocuria coralli]|nr:LytR C-terminal domain-containing protein [Kocuria coralli]